MFKCQVEFCPYFYIQAKVPPQTHSSCFSSHPTCNCTPSYYSGLHLTWGQGHLLQ